MHRLDEFRFQKPLAVFYRTDNSSRIVVMDGKKKHKLL